jgi:hypothetical protein
VERYGEWARADNVKSDGRAGVAQTSFGWGIQRYVDEIGELEKLECVGSDGERQEVVQGRWIDSVYANLPTQTRADGGTTLLEELLSIGFGVGPAMREHVDEGVSLINDLLDYERGEEGEVVVAPKLYFSESCVNTIFGLRVWTGKDGRGGASKDPIDCLRYMACARLVAYSDSDLNVYGGGHY